jgi:meso-butanediol dehydrogenase/(S,S)-butanediol dehydrogenase/diacetyl reductase
VLITGGASGQGLAAARMLVEAGAWVAIADLDGERAEAAARELGGAGRVLAIRADVSREAEVQAMVAATLAAYGRVDVLINNAGIGSSAGVMKSILDTDEALLERVLAVNLTSVVWGCKHVIPPMLAQGGGAIVNNASISGLVGTGGAAAYHAAKGGVVALTRSLAADWGPRGIRVNAVCPGSVDTPMYAVVSPEVRASDVGNTPLGRIARPEEIAAAVVAMLEMSDRGMIPELSVWATNPK